MRFSHLKHTEGCFKRFVWTIYPQLAQVRKLGQQEARGCETEEGIILDGGDRVDIRSMVDGDSAY